jgi:hypothetical protein
MEEAGVNLNQPLMTYYKSAEVPQPGKCTFNNPSPLVPTQLAPILVSGSLVVTPSRDDRLNTTSPKYFTKRVRVIASICYKPLRISTRSTRSVSSPHSYSTYHMSEQLHLRGGCRVQVCSQRSTRAIDQNHPLCALATLSLADFVPPFLAGAKLPSAKHSSQRILLRSLSCARKARHISSRTPLPSHSRNLRQQVEALPYSLGNSLHCAPVQSIHNMPSKQRLSSTLGLPPLGFDLYRGRCTRTFSHCSSVNPLHIILSNNHISPTMTRRF